MRVFSPDSSDSVSSSRIPETSWVFFSMLPVGINALKSGGRERSEEERASHQQRDVRFMQQRSNLHGSMMNSLGSIELLNMDVRLIEGESESHLSAHCSVRYVCIVSRAYATIFALYPRGTASNFMSHDLRRIWIAPTVMEILAWDLLQ
jgi:hypothetical protein